MTEDKKLTRHWVEAYVDVDQVSFEVTCEHPDDCQETAEEVRKLGCAVKDFWGDMGSELFGFPLGERTTFGKVEVACDWRGIGEDCELYLVPPPGRSSVSAPDSTPQVHGDERTPPARYAGIAETAEMNSAAVIGLADKIMDAAETAVREAGCADPNVWASTDDAGRAAAAAVLFELAAAEKTYGVGTLLKLAAEVRGSVSGGGNATK